MPAGERRLQPDGTLPAVEASCCALETLHLRSQLNATVWTARVKLAKQRATERAKERSEWEALQTAERAAVERRLLAEKEARLREEREREARWGTSQAFMHPGCCRHILSDER